MNAARDQRASGGVTGAELVPVIRWANQPTKLPSNFVSCSCCNTLVVAHVLPSLQLSTHPSAATTPPRPSADLFFFLSSWQRMRWVRSDLRVLRVAWARFKHISYNITYNILVRQGLNKACLWTCSDRRRLLDVAVYARDNKKNARPVEDIAVRRPVWEECERRLCSRGGRAFIRSRHGDAWCRFLHLGVCMGLWAGGASTLWPWRACLLSGACEL